MAQARTLAGPIDRIEGRVRVPTSKSLSNRALIAAAVAEGAEILDPLDCEDTRLLANALERSGWPLEWSSDRILVGNRKPSNEDVLCDLGNSGTGSRLVLSLLATTTGTFVVDGTPRLRERPMVPLIEALGKLGASIESDGGYLPVRVEGKALNGGQVSLRPEVSSQFVTSLVMAAPLMKNGLDLRLEGEVPSRPYLDLTVDVLEHFGNRPEVSEGGARWRVAGSGLRPSTYRVEGDWSAAAFFLCAAGMRDSIIEIEGLSLGSNQGDRALCEILQDAGVEISDTDTGVRVVGPTRRGLDADLTDTPDLFPALAALAGSIDHRSMFRGLEHLKHKESDRLAVMIANLRELGATLEMEGESLLFHRAVRVELDEKRQVTAAEDHRIAMAMAVTALAAGPLNLDDGNCVQKSFPGFWQQWEVLLP